MNDCLWGRAMVCGVESCDKCEKYLSMNSFEGRTLLRNYEEDVNDAIDPVKRKWRVVYDLYKHRHERIWD